MSMLVPLYDLSLKEVEDTSVEVVFFVDAGMSMLVPLCDLSQQRVAVLPAEASQILDPC